MESTSAYSILLYPLPLNHFSYFRFITTCPMNFVDALSDCITNICHKSFCARYQQKILCSDKLHMPNVVLRVTYNCGQIGVKYSSCWLVRSKCQATRKSHLYLLSHNHWRYGKDSFRQRTLNRFHIISLLEIELRNAPVPTNHFLVEVIMVCYCGLRIFA